MLLTACFVAMLFPHMEARAQFLWTNNPDNPRWTDGSLALEPAVLYDAGRAKYDLWYVDLLNIKRLVSDDGVTWSSTGNTQSVTNLFSTTLCSGAEVFKVGSTYYMYVGCQEQNAGSWYLGLASSTDGGVWTKHASSPALSKGSPGSWDDTYVIGSHIAVKNGIYYMFYAGNGGAGNEVGLATSQDGVHWEKSGGNPVIRNDAMGVNTSTIGPVGVEVVDGEFYMVLKVNNSTGEPTYNLLTSTNGVSWSFYDRNPILTRGGSGTWNCVDLGGGSLRYILGQFRLWYCADDYSQVWRIGLATSVPGNPPEAFWHQTGGPLATQDVRSFTSNSQGSLFAGTWTHGEVYKTTNNGDAWTLCGALPVPDPVLGLATDSHDHLFAGVWTQGVARSTDNGMTWQMKNNGLTSLTPRAVLMDKQNNMWVATEAGAFYSTNDGDTWILRKAGTFGALFLDSTGAILTGDYQYYFRSTDNGATWSSTPVNTCFLAGIHADGSYYGYTSSAQLFRSTNYCASWTDLHTGVSWSGAGAAAAMACLSNGNVLFAESGDAAGVLRSTNNGESWEVTNSGLTTLHTTCLYANPNGYVFLGTGSAGVFRSSTSSTPPQNITVSLPHAPTAAGSAMEIPVNVTSLSGQRILSFEFTLTCNTPDSILSFDPAPITAGTLSGASGWSVQINTTTPNQVTVGAYGATPLSGEGVLLKLKVHTATDASAGDSTGLVFTHLLFNTGSIQTSLVNGSVTVHERVCGDADENGTVQAYDAALTLREALGPMTPPPAPLTTMGRINADINKDGKVQAFDAALILRHVVGLSMPESTVTCFNVEGVAGSPAELALTGQLNSKQYAGGQWTVQVHVKGVPAGMQVIAYSFELEAPVYPTDEVSLTLPQLAQGYLATVNSLGNGRFNVGIINPNGVDVENIPLTLKATYSSSLNTITFRDLLLNDVPNNTITLANIISSVEPARNAQPQSYDLVGAYPNPFNPSTRIALQLPSSARVHLEVYTAQGSLVKVLLDDQMGSGRHEVVWDGTNRLGQTVASGEYFCTMHTGSFVKTIRLLLVK
jgi:hypothetical protein